MSFEWKTQGFEAFSKGKPGNGGQNIYVSAKGILQRIHQTDISGNGYMDLIFCNSQSHEELVPIAVYTDPINHPEKRRDIYIGGATDAVICDLTGDGRQSMVWSCRWDGMTLLNNSMVCYPPAPGEAIGEYLNYLPAQASQAVAAGDFDGDGKCDVVFLSAGELKFFFQDNNGFTGKNMKRKSCSDVTALCAVKFPGEARASLLMRKENGSVTMLKDFEEDSVEKEIFPMDPDYKPFKADWQNYTQAVAEPVPKLKIISIDSVDHLTLFRKNSLHLYPVTDNGFGEPLIIECKNGLAAVAGDVFNRGRSDLLIAARELIDDQEYSYLVTFEGNSYKKTAIPTFRACDAAMGHFSGGKGLDLVICQCRTFESFDHYVLIYPTGNSETPAIPAPLRLPVHDPNRILVITDTCGKDQLVVGNLRSGSSLGNPDNRIYLGSASGYHQHDYISLPGFGSVDAVVCDLNDNGKTDIVFSNASELAPWLDPGSYLYYRQNDGKFNRNPQCLKTLHAHGVVCGDLNHDGYLDLVFCGFDNPVLKVFYGSEKGFSEENSVEIRMEEDGKIYKEPRFLALADLNGNGYLDLLVTMINEEESFVLWGSEKGFSFDNKQRFNVHHSCNVKIADLNGNGYPDIIWGGHSPTPGIPVDSFVYIYWGGADGYSESRRTMLPSYAVNSMSVADFNNDGLPDIFVASYQNERERDIYSYIYWNSPSGFSANNRTCLATHAVSGSVAADFNDDGFIDLAVGNHKVNGDHVSYSTVWYNSKDGFDAKNTVNLPSSGVHGMCNVDPGNILDRSFDEFYESEIHEIPEHCGVSEIFWDAEIPHKSAVSAQLRSANTLEELAHTPWRGPLNEKTRFSAHDRVEKDVFTGKFVQYRLILSSHNSLNTPRVTSVTVKFERLNRI